MRGSDKSRLFKAFLLEDEFLQDENYSVPFCSLSFHSFFNITGQRSLSSFSRDSEITHFDQNIYKILKFNGSLKRIPWNTDSEKITAQSPLHLKIIPNDLYMDLFSSGTLLESTKSSLVGRCLEIYLKNDNHLHVQLGDIISVPFSCNQLDFDIVVMLIFIVDDETVKDLLHGYVSEKVYFDIKVKSSSHSYDMRLYFRILCKTLSDAHGTLGAQNFKLIQEDGTIRSKFDSFPWKHPTDNLLELMRKNDRCIEV